MKVIVLMDVTLERDLWYIIECDQGVCKQRLYLRRYEDFSSLHMSLKDSAAAVGGRVVYGRSRRVLTLPDLPQGKWFKSTFKSWGFGQSRRMVSSLQRWLEVVLEGLATEEDEPLVENFFGEGDIPDHIGEEEARFLRSQLKRLAPIISFAENQSAFAIGTEVMVKGLEKMQAYNGQVGRVIGYDREKHSYRVVLSSGKIWTVAAKHVVDLETVTLCSDASQGHILPLPIGGSSSVDSQPLRPLADQSTDLSAALRERERERFASANDTLTADTYDEEMCTFTICLEPSFPAMFIATASELAEVPIVETESLPAGVFRTARSSECAEEKFSVPAESESAPVSMLFE